MGSSQEIPRRAGARVVALTLAGLSAMLMAPKCGQEVIVPASDPTPPAVRLYFVGADNKTETVPVGGLRKTIAPGQQLVVAVEGKDPEGLMRVTLSSSSSLACVAGTLTEERVEDVLHTETNEVKAGEIGNTMLITSLTLDGKLTCNPGLIPRGRQIKFFGTAENHGGGVSTTPALVVEVDVTRPPLVPPK